jgi:hypothetical protein
VPTYIKSELLCNLPGAKRMKKFETSNLSYGKCLKPVTVADYGASYDVCVWEWFHVDWSRMGKYEYKNC